MKFLTKRQIILNIRRGSSQEVKYWIYANSIQNNNHKYLA